MYRQKKKNNNLKLAATVIRQEIMNTIEINIEGLKNLNIVDSTIANTETYTIEYFFNGCSDIFTKDIEAEDLMDAVYEAKIWIESENAKVSNKRKAGNYIDRAFIGEKIALTF